MQNDIVTREEWLEARRAHLQDEKAFTKARDALSARRRALPWVRIDKPYAFQTLDGEESLPDLFGSHSQLIVSHFMFGPDWEQGCPSCSFMADGYDGLDIHLAHRDAAFVAVSNTSLEKIERYRARMGWSFRWASSLGSDFNRDFGVSFTPEEMAAGEMTYNYQRRRFPASEAPGMSIFHKPDTETVVHTYSTYGRGLDMLIGAYHLMDMLPKGRDEDEFEFSMEWLRRHDQYDD